MLSCIFSAYASKFQMLAENVDDTVLLKLPARTLLRA